MADQKTSSSFFIKALNAIFYMCCVCGLLWQLALIFEIYFKYKVATRIQIGIPDYIKPVATSFCSRFTDNLDFERMNAATGRDWSFNPWNGSVIQHHQDIIRVSEIFAFTPAENDSVSKVRFRKKNSYERIDVNGTEVYDYVDVMKYVYLEHICYRFRIRDAVEKPYGYYAVTPAAAGVIYEITLSESLRRSDLIKIAMHAYDRLPFRSLKYHPVLWRQYVEPREGPPAAGKAKYNNYRSFHTLLKSHLLPAPYETDCFDYSSIGVASDARCVQNCVYYESMRRYNLVPFSVMIIWQNITQSMVSAHDIKNFTMAQELIDIEDDCSRVQCKRKHCLFMTSMTTTEVFEAEEFNLMMAVPSQPWVNVTSNPSLNLVEFLTYVMSTISTWTGMSVMSFMPTHLLNLIKSRQVQGMFKSRTRVIRLQQQQQQVLSPRTWNKDDRFFIPSNQRPSAHWIRQD